MEKIGENQEESPKQTTKARLLEAQGKNVPLDLFLFSCLEQERLLKATIDAGRYQVSWPFLADVVNQDHKDYLDTASFENALHRLIGWYREQFPDLSARTPLDHQALSSIVTPLVALNRDLDRLHQWKFETPLPVLDELQKPEGVWSAILTLLESSFSQYYLYIAHFIKWAHAPELKEEFIPGSRPPIGRYAPPPLLRKDGMGGRRNSTGGAPERSGGHQNRSPRPNRLEKVESQKRPNMSETSDRNLPARKNRQGRDDRAPRKDRGSHRPSETETLELTKAALMEVEEALAKLQREPSLKEVLLNPTNSFYRRIQHQRAVEAGFVSNSIGEGPSRAVQVSRKG